MPVITVRRTSSSSLLDISEAVPLKTQSAPAEIPGTPTTPSIPDQSVVVRFSGLKTPPQSTFCTPHSNSESLKRSSPAITGRPAGGVTVAEVDAGLPEDGGYEKVADRAVEAARSMDGYIRTLIAVIQKHGKTGTEKTNAVKFITFGELFELTANVFDSLVGIIKTANK